MPKSPRKSKGMPVPMQGEINELTGRFRNGKEKKRRRVLKSGEKEDLIRGYHAGRFLPRSPKKAQVNRRVHEALACYSKKHAKYYSHRPIDWLKRAEKSPQILGCFSRAVAQADLAGATMEDYMEAQFYWFNDYYARAPAYREIASTWALFRYSKWVELKVQDQVPKATVHPATVGEVETKLSLEVRMAYELKVLDEMIKQWGGEKKVWELFGGFDDELMFPNAFKFTRPLWVELYKPKSTSP